MKLRTLFFVALLVAPSSSIAGGDKSGVIHIYTNAGSLAVSVGSGSATCKTGERMVLSNFRCLDANTKRNVVCKVMNFSWGCYSNKTSRVTQ